MFEKANGAFAIVVVEWEEGNLSRVVAGRDPFGIKPLFFAHHGETAGHTDLSPWERGASPSAGFSLVSSLAIVGDAYNGGAELPPGTWIDIDVGQASMVTQTHYTCPPLSVGAPQNGSYAWCRNDWLLSANHRPSFPFFADILLTCYLQALTRSPSWTSCPRRWRTA